MPGLPMGADAATRASGPETHSLHRLFSPRSIAVIGASDRNSYSHLLNGNLLGIGFTGRIFQVNPGGGEAHGRPSVRSCRDIGEVVDAACIMVPIAALMDAVTDAIAAGIRNLVILTSGFAEVGADGAERQAALAALCAASGVRVIGPNSLGYRNYVDRVALGCIPYVEQYMEPSIAVISASGSVSLHVSEFAAGHGISLTHAIATGNEMSIATADIVDYLVDHPRVKGIALFLETIKDTPSFVAAAEKAKAARKPIVVLKVGAAEATAAVAAAHTGALVGDDRVFDAACERLALVRVSTIEELAMTTALLAEVGPIDPPGVSITSISGGSSEIMSDLGDRHGVSIPQFEAETSRQLREVVSDLGQTYNPIDLTGAAVRDTSLWVNVPRITSSDPQIGLVVINYDIPAAEDPARTETLEKIAEGLKRCSKKTLLVNSLTLPINEYGRAYLARHDIRFAASGIGMTIAALGKAAEWTRRLRLVNPSISARADLVATKPMTERAALDHLAKHGVPVIPAKLATSAAEAVAAARTMTGPVVLKILSEDIDHKSDVGAVKLRLDGDAAVADAYDAIIDAVAKIDPAPRVEGVIVSPMRSEGVELFVGIARDPQWGLVMALGLGGIWVEALDDTALCLLPASREEIVAAFTRLRAAKLLTGFRGMPAVDMTKLADAVIAIGDAALALGPDLAAFEVNPLLAKGDLIEALDALAVWSSGAHVG